MNLRPSACKADALPTELQPQMVGLKRLELLAPSLSEKCSNQLSYRPQSLYTFLFKECSFKSFDMWNRVPFLFLFPIGNFLHRKEVIQPHLPIQLPCYDLAPINSLTLGALFLAVREATLGTTIFHGLTGGVYKARERIHRGVLIRDY